MEVATLPPASALPTAATPQAPAVELDARSFREAFAELPSGVSLITTAGPDGPQGMTASAVCSLSLDPLLLLVCIDNRSGTLRAIRDNGRFAVNVLGEAQADLSTAFAQARAPSEKFSTVAYRLAHGSPVLDEALAWLACDLHSTFAGGDHTIVVGRVSGIGRRPGAPLVWHGGRYRRLRSEAAADRMGAAPRAELARGSSTRRRRSPSDRPATGRGVVRREAGSSADVRRDDGSGPIERIDGR